MTPLLTGSRSPTAASRRVCRLIGAATRTAHLAVGPVIWASLAAAVLDRRPPRTTLPAAEAVTEAVPAEPPAPRPVPAGVSAAGAWRQRARRQRARAYFLLTKPRVIELLLVTTVPAMVLAEGGFPSPLLITAVLIGGALAAGGANTINCYIDRDRDRAMRRTHHRPLPTGQIRPEAALRFGLALEVVAFAWLWATANLLAASLAVAATVFYVFVYSMWLKPRTAQNIVIGGAGGAVPVLVGWAAVTRDLGSPAWVLFAIIFTWTPPHFWALAIRYRDDYAAAGVPVLPVVAGIVTTTRQILAYSVGVVTITLLLVPVADMGVLYLLASLSLGVGLVWRALQLRRHRSPGAAMRLFRFSNAYLALLFAAVAVDVLVASGI